MVNKYFVDGLNKLKIPVLSILSIFSLNACQPQTMTGDQANQALYGQWRSTHIQGDCAISLRFNDDATLIYRSGKKTYTFVYVFTPQEASPFLRLKTQLVSMQGESTCADLSHLKINQRVLDFVKFQSGISEMVWCSQENDQSCTRRFQRK